MEGVEWMKLSQLDTEQINSNSLHIDENDNRGNFNGY